MAYIDFDGDGIDEMLLQSFGEHILQYDFEDNKIYATYMFPRGSYVYFVNGDIANSRQLDAPRYVVKKLSKGELELEKIIYTDAEPTREKLSWVDVEYNSFFAKVDMSKMIHHLVSFFHEPFAVGDVIDREDAMQYIFQYCRCYMQNDMPGWSHVIVHNEIKSEISIHGDIYPRPCTNLIR